MKIAVAVDFSPESAAAIRWALDLRTLLGEKDDPPSIVAISISPGAWQTTDRDKTPTTDPGIRYTMSHQLRDFLEEVEPQSDFIDLHLDSGPPAERITHYCDIHHIDWLIIGMSAHGPLGRLLWGSTAQDLVARAKCNVAVVHPHSPVPSKSTDFLIGADLLPRTDNALLAAAQFADPIGGTLHMAYALPDAPLSSVQTGFVNYTSQGDLAHLTAEAREKLENIADQLRHKYPTLRYSTAVYSGTPTALLMEQAKKHHADAIFLGNSRRSGFEGWLLGSAGRQLLKKMPTTLIFIPPSES